MISWRRHPLFARIGLIVLASFSLAVLEASAIHTDDGCQVELHCFACLWQLASTAIVALPAAGPTVLELSGRVESPETSEGDPYSRITASSRAPPAV